jgi:hypothetical protein
MAAAGRVKELVPVLLVDISLEGRAKRVALLERKRQLEEAGDFDTDPRDVPTEGHEGQDLAAVHEPCVPFSATDALPLETREEISTWISAPPLTTIAAVRSVLLGVGCPPSSELQQRTAKDCLEALLCNGGWAVKESDLGHERYRMVAEEVRRAAAVAEAAAAKRRASFYQTKAQEAQALSVDATTTAAALAESTGVHSKILRAVVDDALHRLQRSSETKPMPSVSCSTRMQPVSSSFALQQYPVHPPALPSGMPCTCTAQVELARTWRKQACVAIAMERAAAMAVPAALTAQILVDRLRAALLPGLIAHCLERADQAEETVSQMFVNVDTFLHEVGSMCGG